MKSGDQTSEYRTSIQGARAGLVAAILGAIIAAGSVVTDQAAEDSTVGIIAGALVAVAGIVQATATQLGYIHGRNDLKREEIRKGGTA